VHEKCLAISRKIHRKRPVQPGQISLFVLAGGKRGHFPTPSVAAQQDVSVARNIVKGQNSRHPCYFPLSSGESHRIEVASIAHLRFGEPDFLSVRRPSKTLCAGAYAG